MVKNHVSIQKTGQLMCALDGRGKLFGSKNYQ
jgi:hypothetical protein